MKDILRELQEKCAKTKEEHLSEAINDLSCSEKLAVQACFNSSKIQGPQGARYNRHWVYDCILLRIKSKKAYKHLRSHKILSLPSFQTLDRYMRRIKSSYGFNENVFKALQLKTEAMNATDTHGEYMWHCCLLNFLLHYCK